MAASLYGKGIYGVGLYSQTQTHALAGALTPSVSFAADLDLLGSPDLSGNLRPLVTFGGALSVTHDLAGNLSPQVSLAGVGMLTIDNLTGGLSPVVSLGASLEVVFPVEGDIPYQVTLQASTLISGPLWAPTEPCDPVEWAEAELCNG